MLNLADNYFITFISASNSPNLENVKLEPSFDMKSW